MKMIAFNLKKEFMMYFAGYGTTAVQYESIRTSSFHVQVSTQNSKNNDAYHQTIDNKKVLVINYTQMKFRLQGDIVNTNIQNDLDDCDVLNDFLEQQQMCDLLKDRFNISIQKRTLLNYEKWGLLTQPIRGSRGRGLGRQTQYSKPTVEEAVVAAWFLHGRYATPETEKLVGNLMPPLPNSLAALVKVSFDILQNETDWPKTKEDFDKCVHSELWNQAVAATVTSLGVFDLRERLRKNNLQMLAPLFSPPPSSNFDNVEDSSSAIINNIMAKHATEYIELRGGPPFYFVFLVATYALWWQAATFTVREKLASI